MAEGYIIAQVYTSRGVIPVRDASVFVTQEKNDKRILVGVRKTDESGKTAPITLNAPDKELSLSPGHTALFTTCDLQIEHPDYYTVFVKDVQVFADTISLQNAELIPLEAGADAKNAVETFRVLPQNL